MASQINDLRQLERMMWRATVLCLGLNPNDEATSRRVRRSWPTYNASGSAPGWARAEDVCFVRVMNSSDPYGQLQETLLRDNGRRVITRVRPLDVLWICYGQTSWDDCERIRRRILADDVKALLRGAALYPLPHMAEPVRAPELFEGEWWERSDLTAQFYERISIEDEYPGLETARVFIKTEKGETYGAFDG
jgi:hypothetical protein